MNKIAALILVVFLFSCQADTESNQENTETTSSQQNDTFFTRSNLEKHFFTVDNTQEQSLITPGGSIIRIPKYAFGKDKKSVKVYVQEALTSEDILLANLHTQSNGEALSSDGMINVDVAKNEKARLEKPIEIFVPRTSYNPKMNIYKGQKDKAGNINWVDPSPVLGRKKSFAFLAGEKIFKKNCASCHSIFKDATGPALYNVQGRRPKEWLYSFIRNSSKMIANNNPYAVCIYEQWNKTAQPVFENMSNYDINNILVYIKEQSATRPDLSDQFPNPTSCDSCLTYKRRMEEINIALPTELAKLDKGQIKQFTQAYQSFREQEKIYLPNPVYPLYPSTTARTRVEPRLTYNSSPPRENFYPIRATSLGWYNIDILLKMNRNNPFNIIATVENTNRNMQVSLVIPSLKANTSGRNNKDGTFTFGNVIDRIPPGEKCFIFCIEGEKDDRSFAMESFTSASEHNISLVLETMSKDDITQKIKNLKLGQYELSPYASERLRNAVFQRKRRREAAKRRAEESKAIKEKKEKEYALLKQKHKRNIESLKKAWRGEQQKIRDKYDQEIKLAEHLRPLGCNCSLGVKAEQEPTAPPSTNYTNLSENAINKKVDNVNTSSGADSSDYE